LISFKLLYNGLLHSVHKIKAHGNHKHLTHF